MGDCSSGSCSSGSCSSGSCSNDKDRLPPGMLSVYNLDQQTALGTLIWAETVGDEEISIHPTVFEMLGKITEISDDRIFAVAVGSIAIKPLYKELFEHGVDTLYHIRNRELWTFDPKGYAEVLADVSSRVNPRLIVLSGTSAGKDVASYLSEIIGSDAVYEIDPSSADKVMSENTTDRYPKILIVRPGTFTPKEPVHGRTGTVISRMFSPEGSR